MKPKTLLLAVATTILVSLPAASAEKGGFSAWVWMDGSPRPEYGARGTVYIEAVRGHEYAIRLTNPLPYRVAVALSVDGLNTINAVHSDARSAAKWVLGPYETVTISGWQVNGSEARRFYFTGERDSYGAQLGQTQDLGVIEAVFFREKVRPVARKASPCQPRGFDERSRDSTMRGNEGAGSSPAPAPRAESQREGLAQEAAPTSDEYAATGIGARTDHAVEWVSLELERSPAATLRIRYEFRPQLVKLGVIKKPCRHGSPLDRREGARGFEGAYCPEPDRRR